MSNIPFSKPQLYPGKTILIVSSGPIIIGQACEFDYSGTQGIKGLKEEGYRVVLLNSNPATVMTDPDLADKVYIEPITLEFVEKIIAIERPDAILPTLGGQTALNLTLKLHEKGVLAKYGVDIIGASIDAIEIAEDRGKFKQAMEEIGLKSPVSHICDNISQAQHILEQIGLPAIIRPALTLGGSGGGVAYTEEEYFEIVTFGLQTSPINQVQVDKSLLGWKEYEMEVVRDRCDNTIIVCSVENVDPMGVHTGDSITVAPAITMTDKEYQIMRDASLAILRKVGIETGGSNVQFAISPDNSDMVVIEMNPRVSRSSALVSKATGFPIAKIASKLAVGYTLDQLPNDIVRGIPKHFDYCKFREVLINGQKDKEIEAWIDGQKAKGMNDTQLRQLTLPASFEPTIDYVVVKIPKFDFRKFGVLEPKLGTQMQAVGEALSIGRSFEEALMKCLEGIEGIDRYYQDVPLKTRLTKKTPDTILNIMEALMDGMSQEEVADLSKYEPWFIKRISNVISQVKSLAGRGHFTNLSKEEILELKMNGIPDLTIRQSLGVVAGKPGTHLFREFRKSLGVTPVYKKIDSCAGEFETNTNYFYSTYESECDPQIAKDFPHIINESHPDDEKKVVIIGSGPNRIGQGIEFDYTCVQAAFAIKDIGVKSVMINSNPETVSTDFDVSNKLYLEPITNEHVMNVIENELKFRLKATVGDKQCETCYEVLSAVYETDFQCDINIESGEKFTITSRENFAQDFLSKYISVIIQFGGQSPLKLRHTLKEYGIPILGMTVDAIDICDDRGKFGELCEKLQLERPKNIYCKTLSEVEQAAKDFDYNFLIRPSGVIGGKGMQVIRSEEEFRDYQRHYDIKETLLDECLTNAIECDVDLLRDKNGQIYVAGITEHIEHAGIHSGDSACSLPAYSLSNDIQSKIIDISTKIAGELQVVGFMNIQVAVKDGKIFIIEVNPRASRSVPFIAKASQIKLVQIATKLMYGFKLNEVDEFANFDGKKEISGGNWALDLKGCYAVKESVFSFEKFPTSDIVLGPEMKSTGEVMGIAPTFEEAYYKAILATNQQFHRSGLVILSVKNEDKNDHLLSLLRRIIPYGFRILGTKGTAKFLQENGVNCEVIPKVSESSKNNIVEVIKSGKISMIVNTTMGIKSLQDSLAIRRASLASKTFYTTTIEGFSTATRVIEHISQSLYSFK